MLENTDYDTGKDIAMLTCVSTAIFMIPYPFGAGGSGNIDAIYIAAKASAT